MTEVETAKMSDRGQIIIPKDTRDYIDASEGTIFTVLPLDRETIIMRKMDKEKLVQELRGIRNKIARKLTPKEINEEIQAVRKAKAQ